MKNRNVYSASHILMEILIFLEKRKTMLCSQFNSRVKQSILGALHLWFQKLGLILSVLYFGHDAVQPLWIKRVVNFLPRITERNKMLWWHCLRQSSSETDVLQFLCTLLVCSVSYSCHSEKPLTVENWALWDYPVEKTVTQPIKSCIWSHLVLHHGFILILILWKDTYIRSKQC